MAGLREECGVFAVWNDPEAAKITYLGLYAQQHRGQESCGIISSDKGVFYEQKGLGLVGDVFKEDSFNKLYGESAIGHVRYSTTGQNNLSNAQPLQALLKSGPVAIAHNGNLVNAKVLRDQLIQTGAIFQGSNDTECLLHLIAQSSKNNFLDSLKDVLTQVKGAFSLVIQTEDCIIAARDPMGFRPLVLGKRLLENGQVSRVIASESCAFDLIGAQYEREIKPGELLVIDKSGETSYEFGKSDRKAHCVFEHIYFSRPDSYVFSKSVYYTRKLMGQALYNENPIEADLVIPVPDSGVPAALGYSEVSGIPFELGIIRNHYIGRTFILPSQSIRSFGVKIKLNPQKHVLKGKRVVVVDDSLVRGTTSKKIIQLVRQSGAKEVHFCIASPPTKASCYYGVDTPRRKQLIASEMTQDEICQHIGADSLTYLSVESMLKAIGESKKNYCAACFDEDYPTPLYELDKS